MSTLTFTEKTKLEKLFGMSSGYVLDFSDTTFGHFVADEVNINIHSEIYKSSGLSKAKKLREFWRIESDYLVGKLLKSLVKHAKENFVDTEDSVRLINQGAGINVLNIYASPFLFDTHKETLF